MDVLVAVIVVGLAGLAVWVFLAAHTHRHERREWHVTTRTVRDGTLLVAIRGPDDERMVRELPPSLEGSDLQRALRLARADAQRQADVLNRASAERTRS